MAMGMTDLVPFWPRIRAGEINLFRGNTVGGGPLTGQRPRKNYMVQ